MSRRHLAQAGCGCYTIMGIAVGTIVEEITCGVVAKYCCGLIKVLLFITFRPYIIVARATRTIIRLFIRR